MSTDEEVLKQQLADVEDRVRLAEHLLRAQLNEMHQLRTNLTETQNRCRELLLETRGLRAAVTTAADSCEGLEEMLGPSVEQGDGGHIVKSAHETAHDVAVALRSALGG